MDIEDMWFQQDGATCHTANDTMHLLRTKFHGRIISRNSDASWPPRSPDLTPLDYFLLGHLKDKVYANNPATIDALKDNVRREIAAIGPNVCRTVISNFTKRVDICRRARGGHMEDIIYHT